MYAKLKLRELGEGVEERERDWEIRIDRYHLENVKEERAPQTEELKL